MITPELIYNGMTLVSAHGVCKVEFSKYMVDRIDYWQKYINYWPLTSGTELVTKSIRLYIVNIGNIIWDIQFEFTLLCSRKY